MPQSSMNDKDILVSDNSVPKVNTFQKNYFEKHKRNTEIILVEILHVYAENIVKSLLEECCLISATLYTLGHLLVFFKY